ncbi:unnamed protein product [Clonostachys byssicola]|uniref:PH domain-containing protein n=1 Tax=Clonostachys byssicola TaxID=160290 RepID=A0A9N9U4H9_9HYPO|nr:unnamed protein product [Clonostachys byssicola]
MASDSVSPLRIHKQSLGSPLKMGSGNPRPLSELSPMEKRRNSPSWCQPKISPKKAALNNDSSPFQSSPLETVSSPRMFWQNRNSENTFQGGRNGSPSPTRRSSIERLQKASRVRNSNILALEQKQEYDPTRLPQIERPLAKVSGNAFRLSTAGPKSPESSDHSVFDSSHNESTMSTSTTMASPKPVLPAPVDSTPRTPSRDQASPTKSSLSPSRFKSSFDQETGQWTFDTSMNEPDMPSGRSLHRHAKSVTFDAAPPQINEYEMATPDLSSVGSNSREGSYESFGDEDDSMLYESGDVDLNEESFDASLEDTDKTPVVGPDDWRGESPFTHFSMQSKEWSASPMPEAAPSVAEHGTPSTKRNESANSNTDHRPLPPLPGAFGHSRTQSNDSPLASPALSAASSRRSLPSPPPGMSTGKTDVPSIGHGKMSLEERLKLMMLSDDGGGKSAAEQQRERRLRRANGRERFSSPISEAESSIVEDDTIGDISGLEDYQLPSRISRESIMRRVNGNKVNERESDWNFSSPAPSSSPQRSPSKSSERSFPLDPDVPIPSTEDSILSEDLEDEDNEGSVIITRNPDYDYDDDEEDEDLSEFLESFDPEAVDKELAEAEDKILQAANADDDGSNYSDHATTPQEEPEKLIEEEADTPRATTPVDLKPNPLKCIPDLSRKLEESISLDFDSDFPKDEQVEDVQEDLEAEKSQVEADELQAGKSQEHRLEREDSQIKEEATSRPYTPDQPLSKPEYDGSGWGEPEDSNSEPGTPDSVIHHRASVDEDAQVYEEPKEEPVIPERLATIKSSSGSKLKTRVSNTPSDLAAMRETRRQVSVEIPDVPMIPDFHRGKVTRDLEGEVTTPTEEAVQRHPSFHKRSLTLDLDLGLSLDQDFERVMEAQKVAYNDFLTEPSSEARLSSGQLLDEDGANLQSRNQRGYLMRQNTKVVTATDKDRDESWKARSAGNSPVKQERPQSWVVEPWHTQSRQKSTRRRSARLSTGPVPPVPGQQSNATALDQVAEDAEPAEVSTPESGERGRLFVKVMGVKDLDLPIPKNERSWFSLTLDNGVHCVTTAWLELARNAPIGQEFELVVPNDLEFQLTLNVKLEKPTAPIKLNPTTTKMAKPKTSTFSRVFASPKKRKELEIRQREEEERQAQQQRDAQARQRNAAPTAYELFSPLAAEDGSFARSYVCLKEHENRCYGRPYMAEIACFNEWATEEPAFASSVKSKRGNTAVVRRAPYKIGKLELQLLFVPRPKNTTDEDMPKSMNACIRELKAAEERLSRNWEGHLSQQGGDCPYWRRRYFKLVGTKLTAYHEMTRQPRATINLSNAKRLIDDRQALTEKETMGRGGRRRRSAFAEDEEGYMFVEEGFRIRFNNGEVIDFYADTAEDKEGWMKILNEVIGRGDVMDDGGNARSRSKWCELVLRREEQLRRRSSSRRVHSRTKSMYL